MAKKKKKPPKKKASHESAVKVARMRQVEDPVIRSVRKFVEEAAGKRMMCSFNSGQFFLRVRVRGFSSPDGPTKNGWASHDCISVEALQSVPKEIASTIAYTDGAGARQSGAKLKKGVVFSCTRWSLVDHLRAHQILSDRKYIMDSNRIAASSQLRHIEGALKGIELSRSFLEKRGLKPCEHPASRVENSMCGACGKLIPEAPVKQTKKAVSKAEDRPKKKLKK